MSKSAKIAIPVVVLLLLAGAGVWYFVLRDDAPPPASLDALTAQTTTPGSTPARSGIDGTWKVTTGSDVFVGYRIEELFANDTVKKTAVGRTPDVEGTVVVEDGKVTKVEIAGDVTKLASDQSRRDQVIKGRGLQTDLFPDATFKLTEPIALDNPAKDQEVSLTAKGELTLHGQTKPVEVELKAKWNGSTIALTGSAPVVLADYGIEVISLPVVTIDDHGTLEFQLILQPAA